MAVTGARRLSSRGCTEVRGAGDGGRVNGGGGRGGAPLDVVDPVGGQQPEFDGTIEGGVEHAPLAADRVGCGRGHDGFVKPSGVETWEIQGWLAGYLVA
jgi:hypothetical protein